MYRHHALTCPIKKMYLQQAIYPFGLASANVIMGWLLYQLSTPVWGGLLVVIGLFVILTWVGSTISELRPVFKKST